MRSFSLALPLLLSLLTPPRALAEGPLVVILPLGSVEREYLDEVASAIQARVDVRVRFDPPRALPKSAFYEPRKRYRAEKLIDFVQSDFPQDAWKVVAVTQAEISTTKGAIQDWGIAGLGLIGGQTCVLSTHIYQKHSKTKAALLRRLDDLAVHEFGHTLGLEHCPTDGCVMRDAKGNAIKSADTSTLRYCDRCRGSLPVPIQQLLRDDKASPPP